MLGQTGVPDRKYVSCEPWDAHYSPAAVGNTRDLYQNCSFDFVKFAEARLGVIQEIY